MRVEQVLASVAAMASLSLARPWHNTSSVAYGTGLVGTAPVSAGFPVTSVVHVNHTSTKYFRATSLATGYAPAVTVNYLSEAHAAGVFSSLSSSADACSVSTVTVFMPLASETQVSGATSSLVNSIPSSSTEKFSFAIDHSTTSWIDGMSPPASVFTSTATESTTVVVTFSEMPPETPVSAPSQLTSLTTSVIDSSAIVSTSTVIATAFSTTTVTWTRSPSDSPFQSPPPSPTDIETFTESLFTTRTHKITLTRTGTGVSTEPTANSTSWQWATLTAPTTTVISTGSLSESTAQSQEASQTDIETVTESVFTTRTHKITLTRTGTGVSTGLTTESLDIETANSTSWQWATLTTPTTVDSTSPILTANSTVPTSIIPTVTLISSSTVTVTETGFPSLSPTGSEGLSFTGVVSPQTSATISLAISSTEGSPVIPVSSTEGSPVIPSSTGTAPVTNIPSSSGEAVSTAYPSSTSTIQSGPGIPSIFGTAVSSTYTFTPTASLVSPTFNSETSTPCNSSTHISSTLQTTISQTLITSNPSSTEVSPNLTSELSSSSQDHTSINNSSASFSTSISSTFVVSASSTPAISATVTQSAPGPSSTCGEIGNYTVNWDDEPLYVPPKNSNKTLFPPVFSPYHHLFYANGFAYVAPTADGLKEPFPATSNPNIAIFLPDLVIDATARNHSVINFTGLLPGEISAGPRASDKIWEFDAYGADLGCDNASSSSCTMVITGYAYDTTTQSEFQVAQQKVELPPCDPATLHNCSLKRVEFDGTFRGLSGIQFEALVENQQKIFVMDSLNLGWCDNSCAAGSKRLSFGKN